MALLQGAPVEIRDFGDAAAAHVEEAEERVVAEIGLQGDDALELLLGQDALGQAVRDLRAGDRSAHVIYKVPDTVAEGEKALDGAELAAAGGRALSLALRGDRPSPADRRGARGGAGGRQSR